MDTNHVISYPSSCVGWSERPHCQRGRPTQARREVRIERSHLRTERTQRLPLTLHWWENGGLDNGRDLLKVTQPDGDRPRTRAFLHIS